MKTWIYWAKSNSWIHIYIVLNKTQKLTGLNKNLLVLGCMTSGHREDWNINNYLQWQYNMDYVPLFLKHPQQLLYKKKWERITEPLLSRIKLQTHILLPLITSKNILLLMTYKVLHCVMNLIRHKRCLTQYYGTNRVQ